MNNQPVDLFIKQITYLPFSDVISLCSTNKQFNTYCTEYPNKWKMLIDNTFSQIYNYKDKLNEIWTKLNIEPNTYNYIVYTKLVNLLDPITQLMIYYRQNDKDMFNNEKYRNSQRFLALFLLGDKKNINNYIAGDIDIYYLFLADMNGKELSDKDRNKMMIRMASEGSVLGTKYFIDKGVNPSVAGGSALIYAAREGHEDVVKYLLKLGVDPNIDAGYGLYLSAMNGHLNVVKMLVEAGAYIEEPVISIARRNNHKDVVKYLEDKN